MESIMATSNVAIAAVIGGVVGASFGEALSDSNTKINAFKNGQGIGARRGGRQNIGEGAQSLKGGVPGRLPPVSRTPSLFGVVKKAKCDCPVPFLNGKRPGAITSAAPPSASGKYATMFRIDLTVRTA
jgi:hypothetical protein